MLLQLYVWCVWTSVVQSLWWMQGWRFTHCFVSAVPGTHLEGETHTHRARSAILPQTDHIWPQVPPQQRHPAQRSQTRYVKMWLKRGVRTQKHPRNLLWLWTGTCYLWNADWTNVFVSFRQLLCQWEHGAAAGRLWPRCQTGDSRTEEKVSFFFLYRCNKGCHKLVDRKNSYLKMTDANNILNCLTWFLLLEE